jgi:hypothetical protein
MPPPDTDSDAGRAASRRRRGLFAIGLLAFACTFIIQATGWAQTSYFALVRGLSHGTPTIDAYHWETRDESYYRGHYYSVKAPGLSFLTLPLYKGLDAVDFQALSGRAARTADRHGAGRWVQAGFVVGLYGNDKERTLRTRKTINESTVVVWALGLLGVLAPAMTLLLLVRWCAERVEPGTGTAVAIVLGMGTLILPFATLFFGHVLAAFLGFAAFAVLWKEREGPSQLLLVALAGLIAGLAVTTEYPLAIAGAIVGLYAISRGPAVKRGLVYGAGVIVGVLPVLAYNLWAFDSITHFSYENAVSYQGDSGHDVIGLNDEGFFGIGVPDPHVALKLLFSAKGLLTLSPVLALGAVGAVLLYRRGRRAEALVLGGVPLAYLVYNSGYWLPFGGGSPGARFLIPMLPFLAVPLAVAFRRFPLTFIGLAIPSVLLSIAATITLPMLGNEDIGAWTHLIRAGVFEHTIVTVFGGDNSWPAILPVLLALVGSVALAASATGKLPRMGEGVWPAAVVMLWALVAAFVSRSLSGSEASSGDAVLLIAFAAGTSLVVLALIALRRAAPWTQRWAPRAEPQRELSS